jgi:hypothetical protein
MEFITPPIKSNSMSRLMLLLFIVITGITMGCSSSRHTPSFNVIAWNEDIVNNYQLAFTKSGSFYYAIETKNGLKDTIERYIGAYGEMEDNVYLKYEGKVPDGMVPWLIKEASGHYYIQNFTDGRKRVFLRIRPRHFGW